MIHRLPPPMWVRRSREVSPGVQTEPPMLLWLIGCMICGDRYGGRPVIIHRQASQAEAYAFAERHWYGAHGHRAVA
jgi:hypothetical protein